MSNNNSNPNKEKQAPPTKSEQKQANPKHGEDKGQDIKKGAPGRSDQK